MKSQAKQTFDELIAQNHDFATHAFVVTKPFFDQFQNINQSKGRLVSKSPVILEQLGYVNIDNTIFASGRNAYKIKWGNSLSGVYIRPYVIELWEQNDRCSFPKLLRNILNEYETTKGSHSEPLFNDWEKCQIKPPRIVDVHDISMPLKQLINNPEYAFATEYYICQAPVIKALSSKIETRVPYPVMRDAIISMGYVSIKEIPAIAEHIAIDGMVNLPSSFGPDGQRTAVFIRPNSAIVKYWESIREKISFSFAKFLEMLFKNDLKHRKAA